MCQVSSPRLPRSCSDDVLLLAMMAYLYDIKIICPTTVCICDRPSAVGGIGDAPWQRMVHVH